MLYGLSSNPLSRSLLQNVERSTSTFQSGAAARVGVGTTPDLHQNAVLINEKRGAKRPQNCRSKGVKGPWVPCGVSFPSFPLCPKNASAGAMGFWLTERIQRAQRVGHSLVKERGPSETEQDNGVARSSSVRTIPQSRLRRASSLFHDTPKIRAAGDGFLVGGMHASA